MLTHDVGGLRLLRLRRSRRRGHVRCQRSGERLRGARRVELVGVHLDVVEVLQSVLDDRGGGCPHRLLVLRLLLLPLLRLGGRRALHSTRARSACAFLRPWLGKASVHSAPAVLHCVVLETLVQARSLVASIASRV